jgi:hypothetical protein
MVAALGKHSGRNEAIVSSTTVGCSCGGRRCRVAPCACRCGGRPGGGAARHTRIHGVGRALVPFYGARVHMYERWEMGGSGSKEMELRKGF